VIPLTSEKERKPTRKIMDDLTMNDFMKALGCDPIETKQEPAPPKKRKGRPKLSEGKREPKKQKTSTDKNTHTKNHRLTKIKKENNKKLKKISSSSQKMNAECKEQIDALSNAINSMESRRATAEKVVKELKTVASNLKKKRPELPSELSKLVTTIDETHKDLMKSCNKALSSLKNRQKEAMKRSERIDQLEQQLTNTQRAFMEQTNDIFYYAETDKNGGDRKDDVSSVSFPPDSSQSRSLTHQLHLPDNVALCVSAPTKGTKKDKHKYYGLVTSLVDLFAITSYNIE
jgi:hypothetical protein